MAPNPSAQEGPDELLARVARGDAGALRSFYELTVDGWRAAPELDATGLRYGERGPAASAVLCAELSPRRLRRLLSPDGIERTARRRAPASLRRLRRIPRTG